jgi:tetratricopeptide (TPR) repeat protein
MDLEITDKNRKVIPRLRDFKTTLILGELHSAIPGTVQNIPPEAAIDDEIEDWKNNRSLSFATDVVGSGFVLDMTDKIQDAADFILSDKVQATDLQKRIARQVKDPEYCILLATTEESAPDSHELISHSRKQVNKFREQLRQSPRNPVKLVELSREYATLGSIRKALRAMDIAVALAPANRFVLRSATRLYVHAGEIDKAHFILRRAPSLRSDPWLLAAEIAVASLREQTSRNVKIGLKQIGDTNYNPFEISELTSAIATLEMENANSRIARKLFRQALRKPTENSIAQAEWASHTISNLDIDMREFNVPRNYEALASNFYQKGEMDKAIAQGKSWILDQPFAVTPVIFTGTTAAIIDDFNLSEKVYRFGIGANPDNVILRNNLAYVLATNNLPEEAERELNQIERSSFTIEEKIITTATEGLIKFRQGLHEEGRQLYRSAIKIAQDNNELGIALRGLVFLAREEIYAGTKYAEHTFQIAENEATRFHPTQELNILFSKLRSQIRASPSHLKMFNEISFSPKKDPKL